MEHCSVDHRIAGGNQQFVVPTETAIAAAPGEGALDHPAAWQAFETFDGRVTLNYLQVNARAFEQVSNERNTTIDAVSPERSESRKRGGQARN